MNDRETEIVVQSGVLEAGAKGSHRYFENIAIQRIVIATMEVHYSFASVDCSSLLQFRVRPGRQPYVQLC
jgi:transketolase C-terminal domain/subunit